MCAKESHLRYLLAVLGLCLLTVSAPEPVCANASCGLMPLKPLIPLGCKDITPQCQCDANGSCAWVWVCVKR